VQPALLRQMTDWVNRVALLLLLLLLLPMMMKMMYLRLKLSNDAQSILTCRLTIGRRSAAALRMMMLLIMMLMLKVVRLHVLKAKVLRRRCGTATRAAAAVDWTLTPQAPARCTRRAY
jgi:hypothetical protein